MKKKNNKRKSGKQTNHRIENAIFKLLQKNPNQAFAEKTIVKILDIPTQYSVGRFLDSLVSQSKIIYANGRYSAATAAPQNTILGEVDMTRSGSAFIITKDIEKDVFVPPHLVNSAFQGDTVRVSLTSNRSGKRPEGKIVEILERANEYFMGTLRISKKFALVIPEKRQLLHDIRIDLEDISTAKDGDKVVVKITHWPNNKYPNLKGVVTLVLGKLGANDAEMNAILVSNGFRLSFPDTVVAETERLKTAFEKGIDLEGRRDMRQVLTFTIDPATAKDFDDALSFQRLENGNLEIGIHIADVTHFVKEGTELDKEAYLRSTSVYLVDRVLPMLPEILSNDLCSLVPNEDRYVFSAIFEFTPQYKIVNRWFGKAIIHSDSRFAYEEAQEIMESGSGHYATILQQLNEIAKHLRKEKFKNGAISFESDEVRFELDEKGKPLRVYVKERKEIHLLIEDFMLLANREVATFMNNKNNGTIPFVYRVHDLPDTEKVANLSLFAQQFGIKLDVSTPQSIAASFNSLALKARENEGAKVLESIAIRTMAKAVYTTTNIGHYGLGFDFYTHFTSPIRRYSDVLVHRILNRNLGEQVYKADQNTLESKCLHISKMERRAMESERESTRTKQVEFLVDKIDQEFDGIVSGIIERGIFVILKENYCEGMVSFESMPEPFELGPGRLYAIGKTSGKKWQMGDSLRVRMVHADLQKKQVEFELV